MELSFLDKISGKSAPWLNGEGPDSFAVLSSRIRLARNISDFPFPPSADTESREKILDFLSPTFDKVPILKNGNFITFGMIMPEENQEYLEYQCPEIFHQ